MLHRVLAFAFAFVFVASPVSSAAQSARASTDSVPSITDSRFFAGVNVPWFNWGCDFGCTDSGVNSPAVNSALSEGFGRLKAAGIHTVRWWTFEGDPVQITRDASGAPTGLNPAIYADFDAALALADEFDLAYDFVLFSAPTALPQAWITDPTQRQQLADALAPLFERYANNPHILAWELINEPEYDIWSDKIPLAPVQATVKLLTSTAHAHTATAVTVGAATLAGVQLWVGLGLDFHSPHWYDQMSSGLACARCSDVATIRANPLIDEVPIVLGEFYGGPDTDTLQRLTDFRAKGFAGAWAWSLFYDKTIDLKQIDLGAMARFTGADPSAAALSSTPVAPVDPARTVQLLSNWVAPAHAQPGQTMIFNQDVVSIRDTRVLVDFEVHDGHGQRVSQTVLENQSLRANNRASFSALFTLSHAFPPGQYVVKVGVFAPDWATMYAWSDSAGTFVVDAATSPASDAPRG
jgi:hypothetical protein